MKKKILTIFYIYLIGIVVSIVLTGLMMIGFVSGMDNQLQEIYQSNPWGIFLALWILLSIAEIIVILCGLLIGKIILMSTRKQPCKSPSTSAS